MDSKIWDKWAQGTHEEMLRKGTASLLVLNSELELERWLSRYIPLVFIQRIKVQSSAPTSGTSQPPVTPFLEDMIASRFCERLNICGTHKFTKVHTYIFK